MQSIDHKGLYVKCDNIDLLGNGCLLLLYYVISDLELKEMQWIKSDLSELGITELPI